MKSVESSFTFAIWTYSVIIIHNMYVNLVDEGCDILFLPGDELHHARVPQLCVFTDVYSQIACIYTHVCVCVCVYVWVMGSFSSAMSIFKCDYIIIHKMYVYLVNEGK